MTCFLCQNEIACEGEVHRCVRDNSALFRQRRVEASSASPSEFPEYLDALDFFDAVQVVGEED